ncbi:hypothetical protein ACFQ1E_15645 [Sphingomonas canadensis]|uniref:Uncharacterized protein n=1 Tax=Sphingomonas canadensis TaxID=1219257 RepID=A0ABW3HE64_9SPHN|nr:hypothetical protein [Sphingomonas canadensis]MCW3837363.1 hypothetical protein [Sphingomonas canadensis]
MTPHAWTRRRDLAATYLRRLAEITGIDESRQLETVAVYRGTENGSVHWRPPPTPDTPAGIPMPGIRRTIAGRSWILE